MPTSPAITIVQPHPDGSLPIPAAAPAAGPSAQALQERAEALQEQVDEGGGEGGGEEVWSTATVVGRLWGSLQDLRREDRMELGSWWWRLRTFVSNTHSC